MSGYSTISTPSSARTESAADRSGNVAPAQSLSGMERDDALNFPRHLDVGTLERHHLLVDRQPVEARAVDRGKGLQCVERVFLLEHGRIALERVRRIEDSGAAAGAFLSMPRVRSAVGPKENIGQARGR